MCKASVHVYKTSTVSAFHNVNAIPRLIGCYSGCRPPPRLELTPVCTSAVPRETSPAAAFTWTVVVPITRSVHVHPRIHNCTVNHAAHYCTLSRSGLLAY